MTQSQWRRRVRVAGAVLAAGACLAWAWAAEDESVKKSDPSRQVADVQQVADTQPAATQPATRRSTLRKPAQAELIERLLGQKDVVPLQPRREQGEQASGSADGPGGQPLLLEGTLLVERPGRYVEEAGRAVFICRVDASSEAPRKMPILENQLLETMEREAEAGFSEFIVSAEVTRYRGKNYLLLKKVLRRTGHGNLAP